MHGASGLPDVHARLVAVMVVPLAAALALSDTDKSAEDIARRALDIAADICVYTNHNVIVETLDAE